MFALDSTWARLRRKSIDTARKTMRLNEQHLWRPDEPSTAAGIALPKHGVYAQNETYLEMCNPGWPDHKTMVVGISLLTPFASVIILMWYGFTLHPMIFVHLPGFISRSLRRSDWGDYLFGWLLLFPGAAAAAALIYAILFVMGARTAFFTSLRGRIRFNRLTRKVYVLRPGYCGGNQVFDWDRLRALCDIEGKRKTGFNALGIYHPPFDPDDSEAKGEDCFFVGPTVPHGAAPNMWEYIRLFMQEGPTVDYIPANAPADYRHVPRYLPQEYTTYCGKPSWEQYELEMKPGFGETLCHMISQATCSWAKFPKEWNSDSGLGEPQDRPVQTGAVMTAFVYRAWGKLSAQDEATLMTHWGTPEGLAKAKMRLQQEQASA